MVNSETCYSPGSGTPVQLLVNTSTRQDQQNQKNLLTASNKFAVNTSTCSSIPTSVIKEWEHKEHVYDVHVPSKST